VLLEKDVASWNGKAISVEEKLKVALDDKKKVEDTKKELDEVKKNLKDEAGVKNQKIVELEAYLNNEKMESCLSFYNGFNRVRSQDEFLCQGADLNRINMDKVVEGGDLVDEVEPAT